MNASRVRYELVGADDASLALYRGVRDPELARAAGLFVAEGRLVVRRAIESGRYRFRSVLVNDAARTALADVLDGIDAPVYVCTAETMSAISGYDVHRGCLALVERPAPVPIDEVSERARAIVALEDVADPDNVGGIFRNAAAFGAAVLLSPRCGDPLYRKAIRTSMGAALTVPWARVDLWPADLFALPARGFTIAALTPREPAETLDAFATRANRSRVVIAAGNEGTGLSTAIDAGADCRLRIPIAEAVDSLNVAVAVGIALSRLRSD